MQAITYVIKHYVPHFHNRSISDFELQQFCTGHFLLPQWVFLVRVLFDTSFVLSLFLEHCLHNMAGGVVVTHPWNFLNNAPRDVICQLNVGTSSILVVRHHGLGFRGGHQFLHEWYFFNITCRKRDLDTILQPVSRLNFHGFIATPGPSLCNDGMQSQLISSSLVSKNGGHQRQSML